jgi:outer membrane lipoprotein-sorting protein
MRNFFIAVITLLSVQLPFAQDIDLKQVVSKAENRLRGTSSIATMKITTVRPKYSREMTVKSWTKNDDYALMYIASPARDKGTTYLKREKEIWYYIPSIERNIKMPPSMMNQSWMGTDLSNDDLVKKTSLENDFDHELIDSELINGVECFYISLIPHDDAEVIWGKIEIWVDKQFYNVMQQKSYDEDLELVNTIICSQVKMMDGETIPTKMEFFPADKPKQSTVMEYLSIDYNVNIPEYYFTTRFMNKVN